MARRKRKNAGDAAGLVMLLLVLGVPAVAILVVLSAAVHNGALLVSLLAGGTALLIWRSGARPRRWLTPRDARRGEEAPRGRHSRPAS
jgi:membrane protein implicated in regulation of membrane protease activity